MKKRFLAVLLCLSLLPSLWAAEKSTKVTVTIDGEPFSATFQDSKTTRKLLKRFPITVVMKDKPADQGIYWFFGKKISKKPVVPEEIKSGDIVLVQDDCLMIFYGDYANDGRAYTPVGTIDNPELLEAVIAGRDVTVDFAVSEDASAASVPSET